MEAKLRSYFTKKRVIIGVVILLVMLVSALAIYTLVLSSGEQGSRTEVVKKEKIADARQVAEEAEVKTNAGNAKGAVSDLQSAIDAEADASKKNMLHVRLSSLYLNELDDKQKAVKEAEKMNEDGRKENSLYMAVLYEAVGDNKKAVKYYKNVIKSYEESGMDGYDYDYDSYVKKVKELEGKL